MVKWGWKIDCCDQENSPDGLLDRVYGEVYMKRRLGSGRRRERVSEETATGKALDKATKTRIDALRDAPPNGWAAFSADESRLVAYGTSYEDAVIRAETEGEKEPVMVKIPDDWTQRVLAN